MGSRVGALAAFCRGKRQEDDVGALDGSGVLAPADGGAGNGFGDLGGSLLAPFGGAGADDDVVAGGGEADGESEALGAGPADECKFHGWGV